jgi:hypothetical protein
VTWLVWRQHRGEGLLTLIVLAVLGAFLLITGLEMAHTSQQSGLSACLARSADQTACGPLVTAFMNQFDYLIIYSPFLVFLPLLFGALVGAPVVARELEQRTHLLVWTQSITRMRWLAVKLALMLSTGLVVFAILMALLIWWYAPIAQFNGSFTSKVFYDFSGPVWPAAAILALALGIFAGTLTRRTILAIFVTIVVFLAIRLPVGVFWRPNFQPPITITWPHAQGTFKEPPPVTLSPQDWIISSGWLDVRGNRVGGPRTCSGDQTLDQCLQANGIQTNYLTYQPADRFWTFQWTEASIYLAFSALALGATAWLVRRA